MGQISVGNASVLCCDSGQGTGPVLVLAGFIASVDAWLAFNDDWQAVLDLPPRMNYLRMREAWNGRHPKWSVAERDQRLILFREVIIKHALRAVRIGVPREAYMRTVGRRPGWNDSYKYALFLLVREYRKHSAQLGTDRDVAFFFDDQQGTRRRVEKAWHFIKATGNERLLSLMGDVPKFEDDKKVKPLQAADFLAWTARRRTAAHTAGEEPPTFPWKKDDGIQTLDIFCSEETLRHAAAKMAEPPTDEELLCLRRFREFQ